jgi:hypothetical protein
MDESQQQFDFQYVLDMFYILDIVSVYRFCTSNHRIKAVDFALPDSTARLWLDRVEQ